MCQDMSSITLCNAVFLIINCMVYSIGLIGNTLSLVVLHKSTGGNVGTYLLEALALTDNLFLTIIACNDANYIISMYYNMSLQYDKVVQASMWPMQNITQMWTVWMIVIVAGNRYIAVCRPMDAPRLCTKYNVQLEILTMAGAVCVYNIPRFFEYRYVLHNVTIVDNNMTYWYEEWDNMGIASISLYNILYENVCNALFVFILPLVIIIYFNVHLLRGLKIAQRDRGSMTSQSSNDVNNITLVTFVIIIAFVVCQTPATINYILYYTIGRKQMLTCTPYKIYFFMSSIFVLINSSLNFFIYCLLRRQFQRQLRMLFAGLCSRRRQQETAIAREGI